LLAAALGVRNILALAVTGSAAFAFAVFAGVLFLDGPPISISPYGRKFFSAIRAHRRRYAGFAVHLGFVLIAVGVTASSLGTRRWETSMRRGDTVAWAGRSICFAGLRQRRSADMTAIEAELQITSPWRGPVTLHPAQRLYQAQNEWAAEVAVDSSWAGDFYVILDSGQGEERIHVTFVENPLMYFIWWGGALMGVGSLFALWPVRSTSPLSDSQSRFRKTDVHKSAAGTPPRTPHAPREELTSRGARRV
jgi:cytochrome c biogenesis factor